MTPLTDDKTLDVSNIAEAQAKVSDIKVVGSGDLWQLLCKASSQSQGWMKSTKAMQCGAHGALVQVTTQQQNRDGSYSVAEAVAFVPDVLIVDDSNGGRKLIPHPHR